jgi:methylated-DNA-protein-cysteine methyltransferase-like protein
MHPHYAAIYRIVREIPRGRVATYGQVALLAGLAGRARQVGYALHALPPGTPVPWQRVINARGEIPRDNEAGDLQRLILAGEGVEFEANGSVSLKRFQWKPRYMRFLAGARPPAA